MAGKVLEQFAGPLAWIKAVIDLFRDSAWVVNNLAKILSQPYYNEPNPVKN